MGAGAPLGRAAREDAGRRHRPEGVVRALLDVRADVKRRPRPWGSRREGRRSRHGRGRSDPPAALPHGLAARTALDRAAARRREAVALLREQHHYSASDTARALGVSRQRVYQLAR